MPNPFDTLDNAVMPAFQHNGRELFVRVLTKPESVAANPKAGVMLGPIAWETRARLLDGLRSKHPTINETWVQPRIVRYADDDAGMERWAREDFPTEFGKENNYTAIILEDKDGNPISATSFSVNSPEAAACISAPQTKPTIFFELSQTSPAASGQGLLKMMRCFLLPKLMLEAGFCEEVCFGNAMKRLIATNPESGEKVYDGMPNFPIHAKIFGFMDEMAALLERWREKGGSRDFRRDDSPEFTIKSFSNTDGSFNSEAINSWLERAVAVDPEKFMAGCFMRSEVNTRELVARAEAELFDKSAGVLVSKSRSHPSTAVLHAGISGDRAAVVASAFK